MFGNHTPDIVIVDAMLPGLDGWEVSRRIRMVSDIPILMITGLAKGKDNILRALECGADLYLEKPVDLDILKMHVVSQLRRVTKPGWQGHPHIYIDERLTLDLDQQQLYVQGQRVPLSPSEYGVLEILVRNVGQIVPSLEIAGELWPEKSEDNQVCLVREYVKRLRHKLEADASAPEYIVTQHGFGYGFQPKGAFMNRL